MLVLVLEAYDHRGVENDSAITRSRPRGVSAGGSGEKMYFQTASGQNHYHYHYHTDFPFERKISLDKDHIFLAVQLFLFTIACEFCFYMRPTNYKSWGREVRNKRETTMISYWLVEERRSKG